MLYEGRATFYCIFSARLAGENGAGREKPGPIWRKNKEKSGKRQKGRERPRGGQLQD